MGSIFGVGWLVRRTDDARAGGGDEEDRSARRIKSKVTRSSAYWRGVDGSGTQAREAGRRGLNLDGGFRRLLSRRSKGLGGAAGLDLARRWIGMRGGALWNKREKKCQ
jgi:hypothetical protein